MFSEQCDGNLRSAAGDHLCDIFIAVVAFWIVLEVIKLYGGFPLRRSLFYSVDIEKSGEYSVFRRCCGQQNRAAAGVLKDPEGSVDHL